MARGERTVAHHLQGEQPTGKAERLSFEASQRRAAPRPRPARVTTGAPAAARRTGSGADAGPGHGRRDGQRLRPQGAAPAAMPPGPEAFSWRSWLSGVFSAKGRRLRSSLAAFPRLLPGLISTVSTSSA
ncbi:hypothetical protein AB0G42_33240 [Streptomyces yangpuensis]|uniref:hypothetical protein n=1 Tax=Streptomyces yangpuensis TaxID=1648182 RepID=UPI00343DBDF5